MDMQKFVQSLNDMEIRELKLALKGKDEINEYGLVTDERVRAAYDKLGAIKDVRNRLGCSLKMAKDLVERYLNQ